MLGAWGAKCDGNGTSLAFRGYPPKAAPLHQPRAAETPGREVGKGRGWGRGQAWGRGQGRQPAQPLKVAVPRVRGGDRQKCAAGKESLGALLSQEVCWDVKPFPFRPQGQVRSKSGGWGSCNMSGLLSPKLRRNKRPVCQLEETLFNISPRLKNRIARQRVAVGSFLYW